MSPIKSPRNVWFPVIASILAFFTTFWKAIANIILGIFGKQNLPFRKNHLFDTFHFIVHVFPKNFWKAPTGIGIGRSIGEMLLFIFGKHPSVESIKKLPEEKIPPSSSKNSLANLTDETKKDRDTPAR